LLGRTLLMPPTNPEFAALIAAVPILLLWSMQPALSGGRSTLADAIQRASLADLARALADSPGSVVIAALIVLAMVGFAKARGVKKWGPGVAHGLAQVTVMLVTIWLVGRLGGDLAARGSPTT